MAVRTTAAKVKQIIDTTISDTDVDEYIVGANALVTEVLGDDTTITDTLKTVIEQYLTAHFMASTRERLARKEGAGGANILYTGEDGLGLKGTPYGQNVLSFDSTGKFAALDGKKAASLTAVKSFD